MTGAKEIIADDYKDSLWGKFLLETIKIDRYYEKPKGWHWFCAFQDLAGSDLKEIQKYLPKQHPFKSITPMQSFLVPKLNDAVIWLKKELKITGNIKEINFSGRAFKNVDFSFFVFPIKVSFKNAAFLGDINFNKAIFWGKFNLADANVAKAYAEEHASNSADFTKTAFTGKAIFTKTDFRDTVKFSGAKFRGSVNFIETVFFDFIDFNNAIFESATSFSGAEFSNAISFERVKFLESAVFTHATFLAEIKFDWATFEGHTNFRNTKFKKYVPVFYKANFYSDITWDGARWPKPNRKTRLDVVPRNKNAYENLFSHMKELDRHDDEHFFYRQQTSCQRQLERPLIIPFYWLYEMFANYGYGIERALLWWFGHIVLGTLLLFIHRFFSPIGKWYDDLGCSFGISFANAHGFLSFHKKALDSCRIHLQELYWFNTIWFFQTVLGIIFLFLLLLTLRIRFRLK